MYLISLNLLYLHSLILFDCETIDDGPDQTNSVKIGSRPKVIDLMQSHTSSTTSNQEKKYIWAYRTTIVLLTGPVSKIIVKNIENISDNKCSYCSNYDQYK